jgi:hypothetical protein
MRQNRVAGERMFVDYAGTTLTVIDAVSGEARTAQLFVAVLGPSNYTLVMGADKVNSIQDHGLLRWSFQTFKGYFAGPTKLMVIGYGFRDEHINRVLIDAAIAGRFELFVIDRLGVGALDQNNKTRGGSIYVRSELDEILSPTLIGASQRSLREIFGTDRAEHMKLEIFFK